MSSHGPLRSFTVLKRPTLLIRRVLLSFSFEPFSSAPVLTMYTKLMNSPSFTTVVPAGTRIFIILSASLVSSSIGIWEIVTRDLRDLAILVRVLLSSGPLQIKSAFTSLCARYSMR